MNKGFKREDIVMIGGGSAPSMNSLEMHSTGGIVYWVEVKSPPPKLTKKKTFWGNTIYIEESYYSETKTIWLGTGHILEYLLINDLIKTI